MRYNGNLVAGMLVGALGAGTYLVGGCSDEPNNIKDAVANTGGAGGTSGAGGATGVGGSDTGVGGSGGVSVPGDYPKYFETENLPPTSENNMKIVDCLVEQNALAKIGTEETRVGMYIVGAEWCSFCAVERKEWGKEAMEKLFDHGMYVDCELSDKSMETCWTLGVWYIPSNNLVREELFNNGTALNTLGLTQYKVEGVTSPSAFATMFAPECAPEIPAKTTEFSGYVESLKRGNPAGYQSVSKEERASLEQQLGKSFRTGVYKH